MLRRRDGNHLLVRQMLDPNHPLMVVKAFQMIRENQQILQMEDHAKEFLHLSKQKKEWGNAETGQCSFTFRSRFLGINLQRITCYDSIDFNFSHFSEICKPKNMEID